MDPGADLAGRAVLQTGDVPIRLLAHVDSAQHVAHHGTRTVLLAVAIVVALLVEVGRAGAVGGTVFVGVAPMEVLTPEATRRRRWREIENEPPQSARIRHYGVDVAGSSPDPRGCTMYQSWISRG
jgi:hypothetical protein